MEEDTSDIGKRKKKIPRIDGAVLEGKDTHNNENEPNVIYKKDTLEAPTEQQDKLWPKDKESSTDMKAIFAEASDDTSDSDLHKKDPFDDPRERTGQS